MKRDSLLYIALVGLYLLLELGANPTGNFPLNDDWNYARNVKHLLDAHSFLICTWSGPSALLPALCAWLFCLPNGFSFETLRMVSGCFSLAGIYLTFKLLLNLGASRICCFLGAACLLVNPLYFLLSNTFMTDVPFLAVSLLSCLIGLQNLQKSSAVRLTLFNISALAGSLCRQLEVIVPAGFLLAYLRNNGFSRTNFIAGLFPLAVSITTVAIYQLWVKQHFGDLLAYRSEAEYLKSLFSHGPLVLFSKIFRNLLVILCYLGYFVFPFLLANSKQLLQSFNAKERNFFCLMVLLLCLLIIPKLILTKQWMPFADDVLIPTGIGPLLPAGMTMDSSVWPVLPFLWQTVTVIGICSGACIFSGFVTSLIRLRHGAKISTRALFLCSIVLLYGATMTLRGFFDRYLIWLIPVTMAVITMFASNPETNLEGRETPDKWRFGILEGATCAILCCYAAFSATATHDYFSWNRARWQAIDHLSRDMKVPLDKIDGGAELNGWITYDAQFANSPVSDWMGMVHSNEYVISMIPKDGYQIVDSFAFKRWLPPGTGLIYALKKKL